MPTNDFNTGKDCSVVIVHPLATNGQLEIDLITDFDVKPMYHDITSNSLDGYTRTQHIPQNLAISFSVDRSNPEVEKFAAACWLAYRTTGRVPDGTVYQYVAEIDLSTSTNQYDGCSFKVDDFGSWRKEAQVPQKITCTAMDWKRVR